jgi:hypothetical protein
MNPELRKIREEVLEMKKKRKDEVDLDRCGWNG